ncbi:relaxase domain-containing protein [Streptomyces xanthophaeus]
MSATAAARRTRRRPAHTPLRAAQEQAGVPVGRWMGRGLPVLGLAAGQEVTEAQLRNLFGERRHPDADRIEADRLAKGDSPKKPLKAGALGRQVTVTGVDFVFRPQLTLYLLWALGDEETRRLIEAAHERAIERVLEWIEDEAAVIRYAKNGIYRPYTGAMRRNKQSYAGLVPSLPGDMWHALASFHEAHGEPVGRLVPFDHPDAFLSLTQPDDICFTSRVELSGGETMSQLHKLVTTVTRDITYELGTATPGTALETMVGKRHQLALHAGHVDGLARLLRDAVDNINAHGSSGGDGSCRHCHGTGRAYPVGVEG